MKSKRILFAAVLLSLYGLSVQAQLNTEAFDAYIKAQYERFELPAISVAIVKDGGVILTSNYGKRSEKGDKAPDQNTLFGIASLSKAFTAASIGMLVDEGKLSWDDKVIDHLPWFEMYDSNVTQQITIEDLLCHRSGLITFDGDLLWYGSTYTREEAVRRIRYRAPTYAFREEFGYQNLMFMTAGEVIEEVSGKTWDAFVKERILDPLRMNRTTSSFETFSTDFNVAKPHLQGKEIFMLSYDNSGATAALNSSTGDMSKWIQFWLNRGIVGEDTLLSEAAVKKIWTLHTPLGLGDFDAENGIDNKGYGQGWFLMDYNGKKVMHHGGGLPGYISKLAIVPEENLGIIVLTNDMTSVPTLLMYAAIDAATGKEYSKWSDRFYAFKTAAAQSEAERDAKRLEGRKEDPLLLPLEDYLGTYADEMYGEARVSLGEEGLILSLLPAKELFTGKMSVWNDHAFRFEVNDPFLPYGIATFKVERDVVQGFTIELPNYDFHFDKLNFVRK
ncbi:MAG: serine hydrolase [Flavobacteriales bacterium]|nr:serine hydrolase [Flavobacteriales bacterium]